MTEWRLRRRTRLKHKEAHGLREQIQQALGGAALWADDAAVEAGEAPEMQVLLVDNEVLALVLDGSAFLTVRGLLKHRPQKRFVTVDMGAVKFVHNGADVMAPGIVDADPELKAGDWCWVRDERNLQPLAVGRALVPGTEMVRRKGKAVRSVHHLGDKLWDLGRE